MKVTKPEKEEHNKNRGEFSSFLLARVKIIVAELSECGVKNVKDHCSMFIGAF